MRELVKDVLSIRARYALELYLGKDFTTETLDDIKPLIDMVLLEKSKFFGRKSLREISLALGFPMYPPKPIKSKLFLAEKENKRIKRAVKQAIKILQRSLE